jgi:hypothetical protein
VVVVSDWPVEVDVQTLEDLPPLDLGPAPGVAEEPPSAVEAQDVITEQEARQAIRWVTDRLADLTGEPKDRAMEWELDLAAPGVARMLNEWFPDVARQIKAWDPRRAGEWLPPWAGILIMVVRRAAPRVLEGSVIEWMDRIAGWLESLWTGGTTGGGTALPTNSAPSSGTHG